MEAILGAIVNHFLSLAANLQSDQILTAGKERLAAELRPEQEAREALKAFRPAAEDVRLACLKLADQHEQLWLSPVQEPLRHLLRDPAFHSDFVEWLQAGGIDEGAAVKERIQTRIEHVLAPTGLGSDHLDYLRHHFFAALEKAVFADPVLASWRHELSLQYLRMKAFELQRLNEEAAGIYSDARQAEALDRYRASALTAWDIIDLTNLPEGDVHTATQQLLLRQLYMPLRIVFEPALAHPDQDSMVGKLEDLRTQRRRREAGRATAAEPSEIDSMGAPLSIGEKLGSSRRLVVLGDPGGGKTTMLRWLATAFLLRHKNDPTLDQIPDVETLPAWEWIPVLIRCRDIGPDDLSRSFDAVLLMHLTKTELRPEEAKIMHAIILARMAKGEILLLVDGLDEITDLQVRQRFCQELECTAVRYPEAAILVTSRIVGYRDMPYRMRRGFSHGVISDLRTEDKDQFARRWVEVTEASQPSSTKAKSANDLIEALHSTDRIERLTGNPMLLTTLALVKRKVGKLPTRRNKLYAEAVSVLLNWNPGIYAPIDEDEALPQLGFLAYEMCRQGVQSLTEDEVLDVLDAFRVAYPNIRAVRRRDPQEFLERLEERSSLFMRSGEAWRANTAKHNSVWEFRHLTFQEYLASRALLSKRYKDRDKNKPLAQQVAPLAAPEPKQGRDGLNLGLAAEAHAVPDSWREALRLLVSDCGDDDVDEVLISILTPGPGEDAKRTQPARALLAAQCLAEEPNVSEATASAVLARLVALIGENDGVGEIRSAVESAALEVWRSTWWETVQSSLLKAFSEGAEATAANSGGLLAQLLGDSLARSGRGMDAVASELISNLQSSNPVDVHRAALTVVQLGYKGLASSLVGVDAALVPLLGRGGSQAHAAAWALAWLSVDPPEGPHAPRAATANRLAPPLPGTPPVRMTETGWRPSEQAAEALLEALHQAAETEGGLKRHGIGLLGLAAPATVVVSLLEWLDDPIAAVREAVRVSLASLATRLPSPLPSSLLDGLEEQVGARLVNNGELREAERCEGLVVVALFGQERLLRQVLEDGGQPVALRRQAAEGLGLVASRCGDGVQRQRIRDGLEGWLRSDALNLLVIDGAGWAEHDLRLPLLQGASRGLQRAVGADLTRLGEEPCPPVPMLTLTAIAEAGGLRIRTEVVERPVWTLPLPERPGEAPQHLELVLVPGGEYGIGSPEEGKGTAERRVVLKPFALVRHPITQAQWRAVAALPSLEADLNPNPSVFGPAGLWESHGQPGGLPVEGVSWNDCQEWLRRLNRWLEGRWPELGGRGEAPRLALPSESQWEVACRAGGTGPFHFGDTLDATWANYDGGFIDGPGREGLYRGRPVAVGAVGLVNRWGLAEMHGQLWEWCADRWQPDPGPFATGDGSPLEGPDLDLEGNQERSPRLLRGGSWYVDPWGCRSAYRLWSAPGGRDSSVGFRVCCLPQDLFLYT